MTDDYPPDEQLEQLRAAALSHVRQVEDERDALTISNLALRHENTALRHRLDDEIRQNQRLRKMNGGGK